MPEWLQDLNIVDGAVFWGSCALSVIAFGYLLIRRLSPRWLLTASLAMLVGIGLGVGTVWLVNVANLFSAPLDETTLLWTAAAFAGICLAVANLWRSRWWRKTIAAVSIVLFLITATFGINAGFGLNPTLGSLFGYNSAHHIDVHKPTSSPTADPSRPLWQTWRPPADMPKTGKVGTVVIPPTQSHFVSRPAGIYLPPAAQVKDPPPLPLVIMMMGYPGAPDPQYVAAVLDPMAAAHDGLAPIVVVADQIGPSGNDPLCLDTEKFGNAETFITKDVVDWADSNLKTLHGRQYRTIAGYSNGGECAAYFAAKYPKAWGNIGVLSGDEYPGVEDAQATLTDIFGGNQAAYDAVKPVNIFASNAGKFGDTVGVFTVGSLDAAFMPGVKRDAEAARAAGVDVTYYEVPGGEHVALSVNGGIQKMFDILYPRLGLSKG
ncbi:MAG: alpha/beta hydrolase-fold protein [Microbacteriaceae bacterium]